MANYQAYKVFFAVHGALPPWTCEECGEPITERGSSSGSLNVHHRNGDQSDNRPENLAVVHQRCHTRHHHVGTVRSAAARAAMSAANTPARRAAAAARMTGTKLSAEAKAKLAAKAKGRPATKGFSGRTHSAESRDKMSAAQAAWTRTAETRAKMSAARKAWWARKNNQTEEN